MPPLELTFCLFFFFTPSISAVKFDFGTLTLNSLKLIGDAHLKNGSIYLSRDLPVPNSGAGRALYSDPIRFLHPLTRNPIPFSTFFSLSVTNLNPSSIGGGLAFLICSDDRSIGDAGGFLGLIDSTNPNPATVAIEFDTLMDVPFNDINGNHVGVDLNSMISVEVADLDASDIDLKSGDLVNAWIDYDEKRILKVFVSYSTVRPAEPVISYEVDLAKFVDEFMFVGFSGSTQGSTEIHCVEWWSFSSSSSPPFHSPSFNPPPSITLSPPPASPYLDVTKEFPPPPMSLPSNDDDAESPTIVSPRSPSHCQNNRLCRQGPAAVAGVATAGAFFIAGCAVFGIWVVTRRTRAFKKWTNLPPASEIVNTPREFSYRELSIATQNFDLSRIIGHGAFGTVYKGIIPETGAMVAVKRCVHSNRGNEGREEFLSELSIIAGLRHRNLVRLQGWCHEKGEILLVYDYMLHGSLDKALFDPNSPTLSWRHRKKILTGIASALAYLHRECERQVIHRDVKSSNVMLDEGYNARIGDFGLARQIDHDASPDATVTAGTMGYLAPEYLLTGRATEKTDVFSFGAVVLEVACGRRPIDGPTSTSTSARKGNNLVEWVWNLHGEGSILESVDVRLGNDFDESEMRRAMLVGLACSSPDPMLRPSMRNVVQMLNGEADPPFVPVSKPSMSFSTNHQLLMSLQDSVSDYNALAFNLSTDSSSEDSLSSALREGGGGRGGVMGP